MDLISREELLKKFQVQNFIYRPNNLWNIVWIEELIKNAKSVEIPQWIPCSERLPEKRDWYLAVFIEPDTGFVGLPYIADYLMGNHTAYTTKDGWIIKDCTDRNDCESLYHKNLECVAWMPLPEPYKGE